MNSETENAGTDGDGPVSLDDLISEMVDNAMPGADGEGDGEAVESEAGDATTGGAPDPEPQQLDAEQRSEEPEVSPEATPTEPDPLSPEDKTFLDSLPVKHRDAARKWRADLKRGAQEKFDAAAEARKEIEELDRQLAPLADQMKAQGVTRAALVGSMLDNFQRMNRDPAGAIVALGGMVRNSGAGPEQAAEVVRRLATELGVDIGKATGGRAAGAADDPRDRRIAALEERLATFTRSQEDAERQRVRSVMTAAEQRIREFSDAKDASGQAKHPHFDKVRGTIVALMQAAAQSGEALTLEQAYERAVWARDDLREELITARQAAQAKASAATRRDNLERSKAARTPRTAPDPNAAPNSAGKKLTIDQMLDRGLAEMGRA